MFKCAESTLDKSSISPRPNHLFLIELWAKVNSPQKIERNRLLPTLIYIDIIMFTQGVHNKEPPYINYQNSLISPSPIWYGR